MKTHPDNASVLEQACIILAKLAFDDDIDVAIVAAGGIAVRVAALGHHLPDPSLGISLSNPSLTSPTTQFQL